MTTLFIYNFNGDIYETYEPFDATYREKKKEAVANGEPFSRQVIKGDRIINQYFDNGVWFNEK